MVVRSLNANKNPFRPQEKDEKLFGPEVPYICVIRALMHLVSYASFDIT